MYSIINEFLGHISLLAKALSTPHLLRSQHQQVVRLSDRSTSHPEYPMLPQQ
jgi:hypothetical protein